MKKVFGHFWTLSVFCAGMMLTCSAQAAKYASDNPNRQYTSERTSKKAPPPQASAMPDADLKAAAPITFDELRLFVRDWRKYKRWLKTGKNEYKAVAYLGVSQSSDYPTEVVKWMDEHGWATDRFFLLERKFRMTLSVLQQEAKQGVLRDHLEKQMAQVGQDNSLSPDQKLDKKQQIQNTIASLRAKVKAPVTPEEYELIKLNKDALEKILAD